MTIQLAVVSDDERKLHKKLTKKRNVDNVVLKENTSIIAPIFKCSKDSVEHITDYNYIYVEPFKRYYFLRDIIECVGRYYELHCEVDVLQSYNTYIEKIQTYIERQEYVWSPLIVDGSLPCKMGRSIDKKIIGSIGSPSGSCYALTVTNGGGSV